MTHMQGFKIRIYPNDEQITLFKKHIGCCRWYWNKMIELQQFVRYIGGGHMSKYDMMNTIALFRKDEEINWINEVSHASLQRVCSDLENAYSLFFKGIAVCPKFKRKKSGKASYPVACERFYILDNGTLQIQKVGRVRYETDFNLPTGRNKCKYTDVRVVFEDDKWYVSFGIEHDNQVSILSELSMGIDLGIKELAVVANGEDEKLVFHNINKSQKVRDIKSRIVHTQKCISRKYEANKDGDKCIKTNNIIKEEKKLRKLWHRLNGIRHNYVHQTTHKLVCLYPKRVVMEDLNIKGMLKNKHLAKSIQEMDWYMFRKQMQYKCKWNGIEFILANRYYPSSKICSGCGNKNKDLKLSDRTYICPICGRQIDRDYNAALNLSRYEEQAKEALQS